MTQNTAKTAHFDKLTKGDAENAAGAIRAAMVFGQSYDDAFEEVVKEFRVAPKDIHKIEDAYNARWGV